MPVLVHKAMRIAKEERPGAVHLELPEDIAAEKCDTKPYDQVYFRRPQADGKTIGKACEMIQQAKMPLILSVSELIKTVQAKH